MREISVTDLIPIIKTLILDANFAVSPDTMKSLEQALLKEESPVAKEILTVIIENHKKSLSSKLPLCQDTGTVVFFVEVGQSIHFIDGHIVNALNQAVREAYEEGYLRKSIVKFPFGQRINSGDNTPAIIHWDIVPGDKLKITVAPKGGGAENMSRIAMLKPADGEAGIMDFVIETVEIAGGNPCPPIIVGVGIGGNFEQSAILAKKALMQDLDAINDVPELARLEALLLEKINKLGIGPMGMGGKITALGVNILANPCHIASLPVAVNIQCHAARHKSIVI